MVVIGLGKNLLLKFVLGHCGTIPLDNNTIEDTMTYELRIDGHHLIQKKHKMLIQRASHSECIKKSSKFHLH